MANESRATRRALHKELRKQMKKHGLDVGWRPLAEGEHTKPGVQRTQHVISRSETYDARPRLVPAE